MLDNDGYPTQESLDAIKAFDVVNQPLSELLLLLRETWWMPDGGFKLKGYRLELHTGGWSGNEETISCLQECWWFFALFWRKSTAGGHYYFAFNGHFRAEVRKFKRLVGAR